MEKDKSFRGPTTIAGERRALVENEKVYLILIQSPEFIRTRLGSFMQFDSTLIGQVPDHMASYMATWYFPKTRRRL